MQPKERAQRTTLLLVLAATIFGMVLSGTTDLGTTVDASPASNDDSHAVVVETSTAAGLPSFADLAEAVSPAVVSIQATTIEEGRGDVQNPFDFFFGPRRRDPRDPREEAPEQRQPRNRRSDSSGSGFVISSDGYIVTNHHVIEDATELRVFLNGRQYEAEVKGDDPATDLALLKIEPEEDLQYLRLTDSDTTRVGDWVMVIGSPLQLQNSVSVGVISAKGRSINITPDSSLENFIQTDAAINFGNSGGPLVDLTGAVVGIATAINFGAENIGFAVPSNTLSTILPQLRESGTVRRGYLGVNIGDLDHMDAEAFGLDSTDGALITQVVEDGPSEKAGLKHGDVILEVDGRKIRSNRELIDRISSRFPGDEVELTLFRNGERIQRTVKLGERPPVDGSAVEPAVPEEEEEADIEWLGISTQNLTQSLRQNHEIPENLEGAWITVVQPESPLYDEGVRPGDILTEVDGQPISSVEDLRAALADRESGSVVRMYLTRVGRGGATASFFAIIRVP